MRHQTIAPPRELEPILERLAILAKDTRAAGHPDASALLLRVYVQITRETAAPAASRETVPR